MPKRFGTTLFHKGSFQLHSGEVSDFKIDCDALSNAEIAVLAEQLYRRLPFFSEVEGVPRGGIRLAEAMQKYATHNDTHPLLIADDVFTTGASLDIHRAGRDAIGAVLFARRPINVRTHWWVYALFTMRSDPEG